MTAVFFLTVIMIIIFIICKCAVDHSPSLISVPSRLIFYAFLQSREEGSVETNTSALQHPHCRERLWKHSSDEMTLPFMTTKTFRGFFKEQVVACHDCMVIICLYLFTTIYFPINKRTKWPIFSLKQLTYCVTQMTLRCINVHQEMQKYSSDEFNCF